MIGEGIVYTIVGIDPGTTTGICVMKAGRKHPVLLVDWHQWDAKTDDVYGHLQRIVAESPHVILAAEAFVPSVRARRSRTPSGAAHAREVLAGVHTLGQSGSCVRVDVRAAAQVKPWATNERLDKWLESNTEAYGRIESEQRRRFGKATWRHARDAARHGLFTAVSVVGALDPMDPRRAS